MPTVTVGIQASTKAELRYQLGELHDKLMTMDYTNQLAVAETITQLVEIVSNILDALPKQE